MKELDSVVFIKDPKRLPLLTKRGREFMGLKKSNLPVLAVRVKALFEYLNNSIGFANTVLGIRCQECFNSMLKGIYPEIMLDLADMIYVQHERLSVNLSVDVINKVIQKDYVIDKSAKITEEPAPQSRSALPPQSVASIHDRRPIMEPLEKGRKEEHPLKQLNENMELLFLKLGQVLKGDPQFYEDPEIVKLLSESYSYYLFQTKNFPWQNPIEPNPRNLNQPVIDIATGMAGLRTIYNWPLKHPKLYLTDTMPFILHCLRHFTTMLGKKNVEIIEAKFPSKTPKDLKFGLIMSNKFLHHLNRSERMEFLRWALESLEPDGILDILDTDIELQILRNSKDSVFKGKLTSGYLETLVDIEDDFAKTLESDIKKSGFDISNSDFKTFQDETDAYSRHSGDYLPIKFHGIEIIAKKA
jgi:hypothetical protein